MSGVVCGREWCRVPLCVNGWFCVLMVLKVLVMCDGIWFMVVW